MATAAKQVNARNAQIVNAVRSNASLEYRSRVPEATDNMLNKTLATLKGNPLLWNEFCSVLVQRIGLTLFRTNSFENRLKPFKTGAMAYGGVVQEIGANLIKARAYDPDNTNPFGAQKPDVKSVYHHVNRRDVYDMRLNEDMLEEAFVADGQLSAFINNLLSKPQESDEWDEYLIMRNLIKEVYETEGLATIKVNDFFDAENKTAVGEEWATVLREHYLLMKNFYNTQYNNAGMQVTSDELIVMGTPRFFANFDVSVLAAAYHMDKAEFIADRTVVVDDFKIPGVDVALVDRDFFVCTDTKITSRSIPNPATLDIDYYFHHWGVYSASPMKNALLLSTAAETNLGSVTTKTVTTVEVKAEKPDGHLEEDNNYLAPGAEIKLDVTVTYDDATTDGRAYCVITATTEDAATEGSWNVILPDTGTYVDRMGVLHVSPNSDYKSMTITAISDVDGKKSGNVTISKVE